MNLTELGEFVQSRRSRIAPAEVGLPAGPRRRVEGLRREEVAMLAGLSVDYYVEIERGRGTQPSSQVLSALAQALQLDPDEHGHLFHLAGRMPPAADAGAHADPAMLALLEQIPATPALIMTDLHETLVQNRLATALVGAPVYTEGPEASFAYRWFTDAESRSVYPTEDHPIHSRLLVLDLRAAVTRRDHDARSTEMVTRLRRSSREFAELWDTGDVSVRRDEHKRIVHPKLGIVEIDCQNLFSEDGRQRLQFFTAPDGSPAVEQLRLLSVTATDEFGDARARPDTDDHSVRARAWG